MVCCFIFCAIILKNTILTLSLLVKLKQKLKKKVSPCASENVIVASKMTKMNCLLDAWYTVGVVVLFWNSLQTSLSFHITPSSCGHTHTCACDPIYQCFHLKPRYPVCLNSLRLPSLVPECLCPHVEPQPQPQKERSFVCSSKTVVPRGWCSIKFYYYIDLNKVFWFLSF